MKINELLKEARLDNRSAFYERRRVFIENNKEAVKSINEKQTIFYEKTFSRELSFKEEDYLPYIIEKRNEMENEAKEFIKDAKIENYKSKHRIFNYVDDSDVYLEFDISYSALETDEIFENRINNILCLEYASVERTYDYEPIEVLNTIKIIEENKFSIEYKNVLYTYLVKHTKFKEKLFELIEKKENYRYLFQYLISGGQSTEFLFSVEDKGVTL